MNSTAAPSGRTLRRWRQYLADERAEAKLYRRLAERRKGEEREILLALADAEGRHEAHWLELLGDHAGEARAAVQAGRRIATIKRSAGLAVPVALMSAKP